MISIYYSPKTDKTIFTHEESMLKLYTRQVDRYRPAFHVHGCTIRTGLMWNVFPSETVTFRREKIQNGYECYVYCCVERNGEIVHINSMDGETDFYPLSTAWMVTSVRRSWLDLKVQLFSDADVAAVDRECNDFLLMLSGKNSK